MSFLDIRVGESTPEETQAPTKAKKPFLGVKFICANDAYARFYKNHEGTAYVGRCTKCLKQIRIGIGSHGTSSRFFTYDCQR